MDIQVSILNECESDDDVPDSAFIENCCQVALITNDPPAEVSIAIVTLEKMHELNFTYRKKDKPTNVLSFEPNIPDEIKAQHNILGDIVLCSEVIRAEANEHNKHIRSHWAHMLVHGMLHLQGYDHIQKDEAEAMESLEIELLAKLGYPNPYRSSDGNDEKITD